MKGTFQYFGFALLNMKGEPGDPGQTDEPGDPGQTDEPGGWCMLLRLV